MAEADDGKSAQPRPEESRRAHRHTRRHRGRVGLLSVGAVVFVTAAYSLLHGVAAARAADDGKEALLLSAQLLKGQDLESAHAELGTARDSFDRDRTAAVAL